MEQLIPFLVGLGVASFTIGVFVLARKYLRRNRTTEVIMENDPVIEDVKELDFEGDLDEALENYPTMAPSEEDIADIASQRPTDEGLEKGKGFAKLKMLEVDKTEAPEEAIDPSDEDEYQGDPPTEDINESKEPHTGDDPPIDPDPDDDTPPDQDEDKNV